MSVRFLKALTVVALTAISLSGCAALRGDAGSVRLVPDPAACSKDKSDDDCVLGVEVTKVGAADCALSIDKITTSTVGVKAPRTPNKKRYVVWQLTGAVSNDPKDRVEFVADIGVYPVPGQDPGDAEFGKPKRRSHDQFEWVSNHAGKKGVAVSYNFLVTRTTDSGSNAQVRVCSFSDPVIYND